MWDPSQEARLSEIAAELEPLVTRRKSLSDADHRRVKALTDEGEKLLTQKLNHQKAKSMSSFASPEEYGVTGNPGDNSGISFKGIGPNMENRIRPTSIYQMDKSQINALKQAAQQGTPFRVQIGSKGIEHGHFGGIRDKAAITEGGLTPNLLPPVQQFGPNGWFGLPYELTRVLNYLPAVAMDGPGVAWFSHTSNGAEAAYTAEGASKPDLTPVVTENYTRPAKVAGRVNITHELLQDAGDQFGGHLQTDLARSVYNAESNLLLNGTTGSNGFNGINNVSGVLTQAIGSDTALDCLSKSFVALRNDFFEPDLVFMHPSTLGAIRRTKDLESRYLLQLMEGPRSINQTSETETLWGVQVVQTTQQAAGTAAVLSVQSGAAVVYVREALTTFFDPYSQAASNIYQFIAETRLVLATPRPAAICLVSGLPTS
jgi:Phage capsid family